MGQKGIVFDAVLSMKDLRQCRNPACKHYLHSRHAGRLEEELFEDK
jgi:hypothetical protein